VTSSNKPLMNPTPMILMQLLRMLEKKRIGKFRAVHQIDYREKDLAKLARRGFSYDICEKVIDGKFDTYED